jgi:CBS domain-containing protein
MSEHEGFSAGKEARRSTPGKAWTPEEPHRQEMLLRYLGAVASASSAASPQREAVAASPPAAGTPAPAAPPTVRVRDVMDVPATCVHGDLPFLDLAHFLAREHLGAVPVVDAEDRVIGVVSESDLLAKAAVEAEEHRPGPLGRLREHRLYEKAKGESARTLMTTPPITVRPGMTAAEAALVAARSRLKRMPVTDQHGRLVGVVRRTTLLQGLVRDDDRIREEIESRIIGQEFRSAREDVTVTVHNGVVDLSGRINRSWIPKLLQEIREIDDVTDVVDHLTAA